MTTKTQSFKLLEGGKAPRRMFFDDPLYSELESSVFDQALNTANTPGVDAVCVLPDAHSGYGAPIGSVVVTRSNILPGPVGFDVGCGMLVLLTQLKREDLQDRPIRRKLMQALEAKIGMGKGVASTFNISETVMLDVLNSGAHALVKYGFIPKDWIERCEEPNHRLDGREKIYLDSVPERSRRGFKQLGTLGGGNHFLEIQVVELPEDPAAREIAQAWGLFDGQVVVMLHSGSRGFGHAIGEWAFKEFKARLDQEKKAYLQAITGRPRTEKDLEILASFEYTDRELVHAPETSTVGWKYIQLVQAAANYALCNRLIMAAVIKQTLQEQFPAANADLLYDISHNLVQWEDTDLNLEFGDEGGRWVHRKGTTRALPANHQALANTRWWNTGHPVITPGSMGSYSAIQVGLPGAKASFFSINHGAGRRLSRNMAKAHLNQEDVNQQMDEADILVNTRNVPLDESAAAYKNLDDVLRAVEHCGLAKVVAKCQPIASMKGND